MLSGAARSGGNSGTRLVAAAVALTATFVGVGTIYLPFVADRDRLRGMHEEGEMSSSDRREYERAMREMNMTTATSTSTKQPNQQEHQQDQPVPPPPPPSSNSMWKRMNQAASGHSQK